MILVGGSVSFRQGESSVEQYIRDTIPPLIIKNSNKTNRPSRIKRILFLFTLYILVRIRIESFLGAAAFAKRNLESDQQCFPILVRSSKSALIDQSVLFHKTNKPAILLV